MGAKPAQTPKVITKAGGDHGFSKACVKLLNKVGMKPEDCGTYKHCNKQIKAAKKKVKDGDASAADKQLAECQAGHLVQNGCYQGKGSRGSICNNPPPGLYDDKLAPCIPLAGPAQFKGGGGGGEHHLDSRDEETCAAMAGKKGDTYKGSDIKKHSMSRLGIITDNLSDPKKTTGHLENLNKAGVIKNGKMKQAQRRAAAFAEKREKAAKELGAGPSTGKKPKQGPSKLLTEKEKKALIKCLENFIKRGMKKMHKQLIDEAKTRDKIADIDKKLKDPKTTPAQKKKLRAQKKALEKGPPPLPKRSKEEAECLRNARKAFEKKHKPGDFPDGRVPNNAADRGTRPDKTQKKAKGKRETE